ncbi:helix-turn-helix transcriptional regulator [bacterium]|nr:helix-turn-helix transcriptional regulator [bacterium]
MSILDKELLLEELNDPEYRDAFVVESVTTGIPLQIRVLREQRRMTQNILGEKASLGQTVIARLENPDYGDKITLKTLFKLAKAFDTALAVKFVPFSKLIDMLDDLSSFALSSASFEEEKEIIARKLSEEISVVDAPTVAATPVSPLALFLAHHASGSVRKGELIADRYQKHSDYNEIKYVAED